MRHEMLLDRRQMQCSASASTVFDVVCGLGGVSGWPAGNVLWRIRGFIDQIFGGVGMRRARIDSRQLSVGETLDFWRVELLEPPHLLRLRAEMKLPGTAWLEFKVRQKSEGTSIEQTAYFQPRGLMGLLYWYLLKPFHRFIFPGLVRAICRRAEVAIAPTVA